MPHHNQAIDRYSSTPLDWHDTYPGTVDKVLQAPVPRTPLLDRLRREDVNYGHGLADVEAHVERLKGVLNNVHIANARLIHERDIALAECTDVCERGEMVQRFADQDARKLEEVHFDRVRIRAERDEALATCTELYELWDAETVKKWYWNAECQAAKESRDEARRRVAELEAAEVTCPMEGQCRNWRADCEDREHWAGVMYRRALRAERERDALRRQDRPHRVTTRIAR